MAAGRLALLSLALILSVSDVTSQRDCSPFQWRNDLGENPLASNAGKVVLVALMKGYCNYCVVQAGGLENLKNHLRTQGMPDIEMVIVNGGEPISRENIANLQEASSLQVLQDTEDHVMYRNIFRGGKDDFVVYDRCGTRVAFIPHPYSYLGHTITERVLRAVYRGRSRCPCLYNQPHTNPHDIMYGDQPMGQGYGVAGDSDLLTCPRSDRWCRRYLRNTRRNRWDTMSEAGENVRMSNRPRLRPLSERHGHQRGRGHSNGGRHHFGRRQHPRLHVVRSRLGGTL